MSGTLAILGGSSPFTAGLLEALAAAGLPGRCLVLHGRDLRALTAVAAFGRNRLGPLGWQIEIERRLEAAVEGAEVVLHQIRWGGMAGRARDEALSTSVGVAPDETLGPGALLRALEMAPEIDRLAVLLAHRCPGALVLNLTNPLSVATWLLARRGLRTVGLCELPRATAALAERRLGLAPGALSWRYVGLNHRGFLLSLEAEGRDRLADLVAAIGAGTLGGVPDSDLEELGALPTKYFPIFARPSGHGPVRARVLADLRSRLVTELEADPTRPAPSLAQRDLSWYPEAVVPWLEALESPEPVLLEGNLPDPSGLVMEGRLWVGQGQLGPRQPPGPLPEPVARWTRRLMDHEAAVLAAVERPDRAHVGTALSLDPTLPPGRLAEATAQVLWSLTKTDAGGVACSA